MAKINYKMFASNSVPTFKMRTGDNTATSPSIPVLKTTPVSELSPTVSAITGEQGFWSWTFLFRVVLVLLVLAFLGVNVLGDLGDITQSVADFFKPVVTRVGGFIASITGNVAKSGIDIATSVSKTGVDVAGSAVKSGVDIVGGATASGLDVVSGAATSGIDAIQGALPDNTGHAQAPPPKIKTLSANVPYASTTSKNAHPIDAILSKKQYGPEKGSAPVADDATSATQKQQKGKSGYCFIGEDRGFRSCIHVEQGDSCMSGDIFPTKEVCINPNLRV